MSEYKITVPGGIAIGFSGLNSEESYFRAMNNIQTITAPFKLVLNFLELFQKLRDALTSINLSDLGDFFDLLNSFIGSLSQLTKYIPQLSVPIMIIDILKLVERLIILIEDKMNEIETTINKKQSVENKLSLDPNLQVIIDNIEIQISQKKEKLNEMMQPIVDVISIVQGFCDLIGIQVFDFSTEDNNSLEEIKIIIEELKTSIRFLLEKLGG
jgi:hypothetical protein